MDSTNQSKISNQGVAVFAICCATAITFGSFILSRMDHDLKLMSLQAVLTLGGTLMGVAGTLLVGIQAYKQITTGDLPPGSSVKTSEQSEIKTPSTAISTATESSSPTPKTP